MHGCPVGSSPAYPQLRRIRQDPAAWPTLAPTGEVKARIVKTRLPWLACAFRRNTRLDKAAQPPKRWPMADVARIASTRLPLHS